jgi:hypothetical protein
MIPMKRAGSERGGSRISAWAAPALLAFLALGCGGGGGTGGGSPCQQVGAATCTKACACTDGPGCNITQGALTISFDTEMDCRTFLVTFGCSDSSMPSYNDAAACLPLVEAASCTGTGTDAALAFPTDTVCETPP